jgi:predicted transcriptional regulator of viral defense system
LKTGQLETNSRKRTYFGILRAAIYNFKPTMNPHLSQVLNTFERSGKLNISIKDMRAALPEVSDEGLSKALYRQQQQGRLARLSRGSGHWLIVPLQHATSGAPPLEIWLDWYMSKTLDVPYYVGLLSAAESYGASPYAVMVTQVMVAEKRRPISVGRHELQFHTRINIEKMPTQWHETPDGRFKVSTPELTVLDIIQREAMLGGMARVQSVLRGLWARCTRAGFRQTLDAVQSVPSAQRLGALMALDGQEKLLTVVTRWLHGKTLRTVSLESGASADNANHSALNADFKVRLPTHLQEANS